MNQLDRPAEAVDAPPSVYSDYFVVARSPQEFWLHVRATGTDYGLPIAKFVTEQNARAMAEYWSKRRHNAERHRRPAETSPDFPHGPSVAIYSTRIEYQPAREISGDGQRKKTQRPTKPDPTPVAMVSTLANASRMAASLRRYGVAGNLLGNGLRQDRPASLTSDLQVWTQQMVAAETDACYGVEFA